MKKNNKKGFTLVELVIVIAVMAALVAVAIPTVGAITGSANDAVNDSNARTIESMIKLAEAEASKDGDGVATIYADDVAVALYNAKLGITTGTFYYDIANGTCSTTAPASGTATTGYFTINFANLSKGTISNNAWTQGTGNDAFVTGGTAKPAQTP